MIELLADAIDSLYILTQSRSFRDRGLCSFMYFGFGILCLDRFTAKAFVSNKDPVITTAIPQTPTQLAASAVATGNSNYHNFV